MLILLKLLHVSPVQFQGKWNNIFCTEKNLRGCSLLEKEQFYEQNEVHFDNIDDLKKDADDPDFLCAILRTL